MKNERRGKEREIVREKGIAKKLRKKKNEKKKRIH